MTGTDTDETPVGLTEIAQKLGVRPQSAQNWRTRGVLPAPRWTVGGGPAWSWQRDIEPWAIATNRLTRQEPTVPTTSYGTWDTRVDPTAGDGPGATIGDYLGGEPAAGYDLDVVEAEYRAAINAALPDSVVLYGNEFIGPYGGQDWAGYPVDESGDLDIAAIVETVDLGEIVNRHAPAG